MLTRICQGCQIGYLTARASVTLAYYDLAYYIMAIVVTLDKVLIRFPQADDTAPLRLPTGKRRTAPGALKSPAPTRAGN